MTIQERSETGPARKWRCFHCDEVFTNPKHAAEHFGDTEESTVACKLEHGDYHLTVYIRELEKQLRMYRREDSHIIRAYESLKASFYQKMREAEERGYGKGVLDTVKMHEKGLSPMTEQSRFTPAGKDATLPLESNVAKGV